MFSAGQELSTGSLPVLQLAEFAQNDENMVCIKLQISQKIN